MLLVDTNIWIHHFRRPDRTLQAELAHGNITTHPHFTAELALGSIPHRSETLHQLDCLPQLPIARLAEIRYLIERFGLSGKGIGLVEAQLVAAARINAGTQIWTRDRRLREIAMQLGVAAELP